MKVIGIKRFDYTSKKTGSTYPAVSLFVTETRKSVEGLACFEQFLRAEVVPEEIGVGDEVRFAYNRFGGVEEVFLA